MLKHFKILLAALGLAAFTQASAQQVYQDCNNPDILRPDQPTVLTRNEIIVPGIMGYNVYKADLHMHSTYSDGQLTPEEIKECYKEKGYSIVAYTDHNIMINHSYLADEDFLPLIGYEMDVNEQVEGIPWWELKTCHMCFITLA